MAFNSKGLVKIASEEYWRRSQGNEEPPLWLQSTIESSLKEFGKIIKEQRKEKTEMRPTLEDLLKQREDLDKKIGEVKREDKKELLRATQITSFYDDTFKYSPSVPNLEYIVEHLDTHYIKVLDLLTALEEGRLKIDENTK